MTQDEFELHMSTKVSWAEKHCKKVFDAIQKQFPGIQNLDVNMDKDGTVSIIFDETIYTQDQVQDFVNELKKRDI